MSIYASQLRNEITARTVHYAQGNGLSFRRSHFDFGSVVLFPSLDGTRHGNFHPVSYRAIVRRAIWRRRFGKVLTVPQRLRTLEDDRRLCELDSCCSSDALLMNIFCHPSVRNSSAVLGMLGLDQSSVPIFGWRARVPLDGGKFDRTEVDMKFGNLLVEAKLTEASFESCPIDRMQSYAEFREVFRLSELPRFRRQYQCYQLLRNVLAAWSHNASFCLLADARRPDLIEAWFRVIAAIRPLDLRTRCKMLTWQELTQALPRSLREFLDFKYGIGSAVAAPHTLVGY
jgi:hypothetical protein